MKKDNEKNVNINEQAYLYYSKVLKEPFESIEELNEAEEAYYAKLQAKETKAAEKKADAHKVEEAFKCLNTTRKAYKEALLKLTETYSVDLKKLKDTFSADKKELEDILAQAEDTYAAALKEFTDKHDQYHLTLKDGDFETTISGSHSSTTDIKTPDNSLFNIFDLIFNM